MEGGSHLINTDVDLGYCSVFVEEVSCENAVVPMNCDPLILPFFFFLYGAVMYCDCVVLYSRKLAGVPEFVQCCCLLFKHSRLQILGSTFKNNIYKQKWPSSQTIG